MNTRDIGTHFEEAAVSYLEDNGIRIIDRNVRCGRIGEIDLIGIDRSPVMPDADMNEGDSDIGSDRTLVFFEVKYRKSGDFGDPVSAVDHRKQAKIRKCAQYYLSYRPTGDYIRFDVIAIRGEEITWYKNAF